MPFPKSGASRRNFLSTTMAGASLAAITDPGQAAAQTVGVKLADFPDLDAIVVPMGVKVKEYPDEFFAAGTNAIPELLTRWMSPGGANPLTSPGRLWRWSYSTRTRRP